MIHKITLTKEGLHFKRNGVILHGNIKVGTYKKEDVWEKYGGSKDKNGIPLVHYTYWVYFSNVTYRFYSLNGAREVLNGCVVEVDLKL